jgi:hypothetical protein
MVQMKLEDMILRNHSKLSVLGRLNSIPSFCVIGCSIIGGATLANKNVHFQPQDGPTVTVPMTIILSTIGGTMGLVAGTSIVVGGAPFVVGGLTSYLGYSYYKRLISTEKLNDE